MQNRLFDRSIPAEEFFAGLTLRLAAYQKAVDRLFALTENEENDFSVALATARRAGYGAAGPSLHPRISANARATPRVTIEKPRLQPPGALSDEENLNLDANIAINQGYLDHSCTPLERKDR